MLEYPCGGSKLDVINELSKHLVALGRSESMLMGDVRVYFSPLKVDTRIHSNSAYYADRQGMVVNLNPLEQQLLYQLASDKLGASIRAGRLQDFRDALEIEAYRENFSGYWVYTGEFVFNDGVRILERAETGDYADYIAFDRNMRGLGSLVKGRNAKISGMFGDVVQTDVAGCSGWYVDMYERLPKSSEVLEKLPNDAGCDRWGGTHPVEDMSAVRASWMNGWVDSVSAGSLGANDTCAMSVFVDQ